jgi:YD repeat-containing protein
VEPGEWIDARLEFEATTWTLLPGHTLRLAIAGTDWPNCWPPNSSFTLSVERASVQLELPIAELPESTHIFGGAAGPGEHDADGVEWRYEYDVLGRESRVHSRYGGRYEGNDGIVIDDLYEGSLGISTTDLANSWARGRSRLQLGFAEGVCTAESTLQITSDAKAFHVQLTLRSERDGVLLRERVWTETVPR